ncbi:zinc ABC transporter substrate-binding protein [Salicola sp. Rm-C-2C1-2]|uniref:metal ABC transporter solute-binding protein, Zn/Mn family n=1 Tax=Salicola sp. Rm-C-2C1-2 TaxID=3141321 RepID=UPI0032E36AB2
MRRFLQGLILLLLPGLPALAANVVTTTGMIADVARNIAGECVEVEALMGPGVDPHLYEARASDIGRLRNADAIFYNGYSLEGQLGSVLSKLGERKMTLAVAPQSMVDDQLLMANEDDSYGVDPHLWMDPGRWVRIVPTLRSALQEVAPACSDAIKRRSKAYKADLEALDQWISDSIITIPDERRVLVTAHDAFGYYGDAYRLEVLGIQGISTDSEPAIADIRNVVDTVAERGIPSIFVESTISRRTVESVVQGAARQGHDLKIGAELYSDAMGESGTEAGTYIGMLRSNTEAVTRGLGGTVAPWPERLSDHWQGRDAGNHEKQGEQ